VASLLWIRKPEPEPERGEYRRSFVREIWDGTRFVFGHRMIRLIAGCTATNNLGANTAMAVLILWLYREIHVSPAQVGLIFTIGSLGAVVGSILALSIARRIGMGPTLAISAVVASAPTLLYPLAGASAFPIGFLAALSFIALGAIPIYNINQVSYRQAAAPVHMQGRLNATVRTLIWGTIPIGMFVGGVLGSHIGLVPTIYVGSAIGTLSVLWILAGPVRIN
jgi:predicted MFS family arabinose efflux permease